MDQPNKISRPTTGHGKMPPDLKKAMMRLVKDKQELTDSPVANVSAAPLDSNMLEWHCNIWHSGHMYHLILFFPKEYPCVSPSAEFVPQGFEYSGGASMPGKKGTKICLSIFSDFADIHTEWKDEKNTGWSPGYTVQTVLLNVVSFLSEIEYGDNGISRYQKLCRSFVCDDCGHTQTKPFPPIIEEGSEAKETITTTAPLGPADSESQDAMGNKQDDHLCVKTSRIVDYLSKEQFTIGRPTSRDQLFGYGLVTSGNPRHPLLTSPCEFLTKASFEHMATSLGDAQSVHREKLSYFLPLYITDEHGSMIRGEFEETMRKLGPVLIPQSSSRNLINIILKVIPNLMCSSVVQFSKGTVHTSDNSLEGYFALHRLFLWAMDTYPDLRNEVDKRLEAFVRNPSCRLKTTCSDIGQWLMLLSVSGKYLWEDVASAYLSENFNRNVMWYMKTDYKLGITDTPMHYRLQRTFELTDVSRNLLAFQVAFLKIAKPVGMSRGDVIRRYAQNLGFPSHKMVKELKTVFKKIYNDVIHYGHWFECIGVPVPSKEDLNKTLIASVKFAKSTEGYYFKNNNGRRH